MNNNLGPQDGQNLNPNGMGVLGSEPNLNPAPVGPVPPINPVPQSVPIPSVPTSQETVNQVPPTSPVPETPMQPSSPVMPGPAAPTIQVEPFPAPNPGFGAIPATQGSTIPNTQNIGLQSPTPVPEPPVQPSAPSMPTPAVSSPAFQPLGPINPTPVTQEPSPYIDIEQPVPPVSGKNKFKPQQTPEEKKNNRKNTLLAILSIVLLLAVAGMGVFLMKFLNNNKVDYDKVNNQINENMKVKVNFNGYTFKVPETLQYNVNDNLLTLTKDKKWATAIGILAGTYNNLKENKATIQTNFQNKGYTASGGDIKTYEGVEYLTYELTASKSNVLAAYTRLNDNVVLYLSAASNSNQFDYSILEEITPIISSVKENSSTLGIELPESDVSNVLDNITEDNTEK